MCLAPTRHVSVYEFYKLKGRARVRHDGNNRLSEEYFISCKTSAELQDRNYMLLILLLIILLLAAIICPVKKLFSYRRKQHNRVYLLKFKNRIQHANPDLAANFYNLISQIYLLRNEKSALSGYYLQEKTRCKSFIRLSVKRQTFPFLCVVV